MIKYLESEEEFKEKIKEGLVLVDFYADWCGPCKMLSPILETLEDTDILKVNVDKFPILAQNYKVMSIPTIIVFKNQKEVAKQIGLLDKEGLVNLLKEADNN